VSEPSEVNDARRLELISAAQRQWVDALTDLGGRNTLLYYKDRRAGTLDLASADPGESSSSAPPPATAEPAPAGEPRSRTIRSGPSIGPRQPRQ